MSDVVTKRKLLGCPFCGVELVREEADTEIAVHFHTHFVHPEKGCLLDGKTVSGEQQENAWNARSAETAEKPIAHLVWLQGRRGADDVEDYYLVAGPEDKCVDGSDPFPVWAARSITYNGWKPPEDCDGKEQEAFEAFAIESRYEMQEHPMHYLFMDGKTHAARHGWKAALRYVREQFKASFIEPPGDKDIKQEVGKEQKESDVKVTQASPSQLEAYGSLERAAAEMRDLAKGFKMQGEYWLLNRTDIVQVHLNHALKVFSSKMSDEQPPVIADDTLAQTAPVAWRFRWVYPKTGEPTTWTETSDPRVARQMAVDGWEVRPLIDHPYADNFKPDRAGLSV